MTPRVRVAIAELLPSGHRVALYMRAILEEALARNWETQTLVGTSVKNHPAFVDLARVVGSSVKHNVIEAPQVRRTQGLGKLLLQQARLALAIRRGVLQVSAKWSPQHIHICTLDGMEKALALTGLPTGHASWSGTWVGPKFHRSDAENGPSGRFAAADRVLFSRLLAKPGLATISVVDPTFAAWSEARSARKFRKVRLLNEPGGIGTTMTREEARSSLGVGPSEVVVLVYGALSFRKGTHRVLDAVADRNTPENVTLMVAGMPSDGFDGTLQSASALRLLSTGRLRTRLYFHDALDEEAVFRSADAVWVAYEEGFYASSGVLYQAVSSLTPVIAMAEGVIGTAVRGNGLGFVLRGRTHEEIVEVMQLLPSFREGRHWSAFTKSAERLGLSHSREQFGRAVCDQIDAAARARTFGSIGLCPGRRDRFTQ